MHKFPIILIPHSTKKPQTEKRRFEVQKGTVPLKVSLDSAVTGGSDAPFPAHCREGGIFCGRTERAFSP